MSDQAIAGSAAAEAPPMPTSGRYYTGDPANRRCEAWRDLPASSVEGLTDPRGYIPDPALVDAANVAMSLGQPLLLTGEPGTGKTLFAYSLAYELGFDSPLKFETKSNTEARDLFYTFDTLGRFHAARSEHEDVAAARYIQFTALGRAILLANEPETVSALLPAGEAHPGQRRSVVLLDEIDKAPRDVPNDLLNEIEQMYFKIPELSNRLVSADPQWRPVVVVTSNSEKALPDTFLRRCIFYHVRFPDRDQLEAIVAARIGRRDAGSSPLIDEAITLFEMVREPRRGFRKRPGTAELLNWVTLMIRHGADPADAIKGVPALYQTARNTLFKNAEDQAAADGLIADWIAG